MARDMSQSPLVKAARRKSQKAPGALGSMAIGFSQGMNQGMQQGMQFGMARAMKNMESDQKTSDKFANFLSTQAKSIEDPVKRGDVVTLAMDVKRGLIAADEAADYIQFNRLFSGDAFSGTAATGRVLLNEDVKGLDLPLAPPGQVWWMSSTGTPGLKGVATDPVEPVKTEAELSAEEAERERKAFRARQAAGKSQARVLAKEEISRLELPDPPEGKVWWMSSTGTPTLIGVVEEKPPTPGSVVRYKDEKMEKEFNVRRIRGNYFYAGQGPDPAKPPNTERVPPEVVQRMKRVSAGIEGLFDLLQVDPAQILPRR